MNALGTWIAHKELTFEAFGLLIGRSKMAVSRYVHGKRIPDRGTMQRIQLVTNGAVTPNDFYLPAESDTRERAA